MDRAASTDASQRTRARENDLVLPPADLNALLDVARFFDNHTEPGVLLGPDGEQVPLPAEVYEVLQHVIDVMRQGKATLIAPQGLMLTTQEAAEFLGISRPTLVKLLEDGAIPFDKPSRHRRVSLEDLIAFRAHRREEQRVLLNKMTAESSALGTYDDDPGDIAKAVKAARRRLAGPKEH